MTLTIADFMADGEVFCMAVAALAERLNVLQRGGLRRHMFAANPARHRAVELTGYRPVNLVAGMAQSAHDDAGSVSVTTASPPYCPVIARLSPGYCRLPGLGSPGSMNESCHCVGNRLVAPDSSLAGVTLLASKPE